MPDDAPGFAAAVPPAPPGEERRPPPRDPRPEPSDRRPGADEPKPPREPTPPPKRATKGDTGKIADALAEILQLPAVPCTFMGDEWAADHFTDKGRELADTIARASERNEVLRRWCERAMEGESLAVVLFGFITYAYPPLLHWGIVPGPAGLLGVPVVADPFARQPEPPEPTRGPQGADNSDSGAARPVDTRP